MAKGNKLAQLMTMMEKIQTKLDKSEKKIGLVATTLQIHIKGTLTENGDKPHNGGGDNDEKLEEEEGENHSSN